MRSLNPSRYVLSCAALASLAGCGTQGAMQQTPAVATQGVHGGSRMQPEAKSSTLVYVADSPYDVYVYAYPSGDLEGTIEFSGGGYLYDACSDDHGNVWVTDAFRNSDSSSGFVFKYKHGGTKAVETLKDSQFPISCAVDASTGNVAVIGDLNPQSNYNGGVAIYPGGHSPPTYYTVPGGPISCTYDGSGNLFVVETSATSYRQTLIWLKRGAADFKKFPLHPSVTPEGVRWDGTHLAVLESSSGSSKEQVDGFEIKNGAGKKVSQTVIDGQFSGWWIANAKVFGTYSRNVVAWHYPEGGEPIKTIPGPQGSEFGGITVSEASAKKRLR